MNDEVVVSTFRTFLQMLGGVLVTKGVLSDQDWTLYTGLIMAAGSLGWMLWARWGTKKVPQDALVVPRSVDPQPPTPAAAAAEIAKDGQIKSHWLVGVGALLVVAAMLAGCTQQQLDNATDKARAALDATCAYYPVADAAFQAAVAVAKPGRIPASVIAAETQAVQEIAAICAAPPVNAAQALAKATAAGARIAAAVKTANAAKAAP